MNIFIQTLKRFDILFSFQLGLFCTKWSTKLLMALLVYHKSRLQKDIQYTKINKLWWDFQISIEIRVSMAYISWLFKTLLQVHIWHFILRLLKCTRFYVTLCQCKFNYSEYLLFQTRPIYIYNIFRYKIN